MKKKLSCLLIAIAMLAGACYLVKPIKISVNEKFEDKLNTKRTILYLLLFALSILVVFRVIPFWVGLVVVPAVILIVDREALLMVDYPLLFTFVFFFIFAGNLARIESVNSLMSMLLEKDPLIFSILSCQVMSNVPTAILFSHFTSDFVPLLLGVNIGGTGTLIASLASLITFSEYSILYPKKKWHYLGLFTLINVIFLVVMTFAARFVFM